MAETHRSLKGVALVGGVQRVFRDEIDRRVRGLLDELGIPAATSQTSSRDKAFAPGAGAGELTV